LSSNNLSGDIPTELANITYLNSLNLSDNQLSGIIPPQLGKLVNLGSINLSNNRLTGGIPPEFSNISILSEIYLTGNRLSGNIPSQLGKLRNIYRLYLSGNQLSGDIPSSLTNLKRCNSLLIHYNALYTDHDELQIFLESKGPGWEASQTIAPSHISATGKSATSIRISWKPINYTGDSGSYRIYYSAESKGPWIYYGETESKDVSFFDVTGLDLATKYYFKIQTQTDPHGENENTVLSQFSEVVFAVTGSSITEKDPPFGSFDTPIDNLTASGSIPVTGWALDDYGIDTVKIYRELGNQLIYIGDGVFIEGARPDVAATYPTYPGNTKAGWGYMLLTNFLPN
ncbi:MAG: hypothetical protein GY940_00520, partial [bacterium]|nr:hypothetical protein [bacterium]